MKISTDNNTFMNINKKDKISILELQVEEEINEY